MTEEVRKIARRMMRMGYEPESLGQMSNAGWDALRELLQCPEASDLTLADATDTLAVWKQQAPRPEVVDNPYEV